MKLVFCNNWISLGNQAFCGLVQPKTNLQGKFPNPNWINSLKIMFWIDRRLGNQNDPKIRQKCQIYQNDSMNILKIKIKIKIHFWLSLSNQIKWCNLVKNHMILAYWALHGDLKGQQHKMTIWIQILQFLIVVSNP